MSKPDLRAIIDMRLDFIVQNVSTTTQQCHFTDGWGASPSDPKGHEGLQDCLLARYQLCAERFSEDPTHAQHWFDFSVCLFRNQKETDNTDWSKWSATTEYCADVTGYDISKLKSCAESDQGAQLLFESHNTEVKLNPHRAGGKVKSVPPQWIAINGKDTPSSTDWLQHVCDAYTGSPKPASCAKAMVV